MTAVQMRLICGNRNYSSWSLRAWLCLKKAGFDPEVTVLPMDTPEFAARVADYSPTRRVPVLWLDDECVWDSLAIAETVNERFAAGRLWPEDAQQRALARSMAAEMHSGFMALREALPMNCRANDRPVEIASPVIQDIARIAQLWQSAQAHSGVRSGWLFGEFSIADAMFVPVALRFMAYRLTLPASVVAYRDFCVEDKDVAQWISLAKEEEWVIQHEEVGV